MVPHNLAYSNNRRIILKIKKLHEGAMVPQSATSGSAGLDLCARIDAAMQIQPHEFNMVSTGLSFEIPKGHFGILCPRSGLGKEGITLANTIGIIDSDYRGEVAMMVKNNNDFPFIINNGMRLAQLVIVPYFSPTIEVVEELTETVRGSGGFGSTGVL